MHCYNILVFLFNLVVMCFSTNRSEPVCTSNSHKVESDFIVDYKIFIQM